MADEHSAPSEARSELMSRVRQKGTSIEIQVRKTVSELGYAFETNTSDLPGSPDMVNREDRWPIFVNGCFWHAHRGCRLASAPKSNRQYWIDKFKRNRERDKRKERRLMGLGCDVLVLWECEIDAGAESSIRTFLESKREE